MTMLPKAGFQNLQSSQTGSLINGRNVLNKKENQLEWLNDCNACYSGFFGRCNETMASHDQNDNNTDSVVLISAGN